MKVMLSFQAIYFVCSFWIFANAANWCEENQNSKPCNCKYSVLTCRSVKNETQLSNVFRDLRKFLKENGVLGIPNAFQLVTTTSLVALPDNLFKDMTFQSISMENVELLSLGLNEDQESPLNALKETLNRVSLNRVHTIDSWNWKSVHLPKVENVFIISCKFNEVPMEFSKALPNVKKLSILYSEVRHIQPGAFAMESLETLDLMNNEVKTIGQIFSPAIPKYLHRLDVSSNLLEEVDLQLLSPLEELTLLDLSYNNFESMAVELFEDWNNKKEVSREKLTLKLNGNEKFRRDGCEAVSKLMTEYKMRVEFSGLTRICGTNFLLA